MIDYGKLCRICDCTKSNSLTVKYEFKDHLKVNRLLNQQRCGSSALVLGNVHVSFFLIVSAADLETPMTMDDIDICQSCDRAKSLITLIVQCYPCDYPIIFSIPGLKSCSNVVEKEGMQNYVDVGDIRLVFSYKGKKGHDHE
jgi:hypothetical protein